MFPRVLFCLQGSVSIDSLRDFGNNLRRARDLPLERLPSSVVRTHFADFL